MNGNEFFYLFSSFKILFIASKKCEYDEEWVLSKKKYDGLLNNLCASYLAYLTICRKTKHPDEEEKDLILLASLLRKQFKIRTLVVKYFGLINSVNLKSVIAVIWLYTQLLKHFMSQIFSIPFEFQIDKSMVGQTVNIAIGFPEHSFNFKKNIASYPSSFAEYTISNKSDANKQDLFISLDGYDRVSIKKEGSPSVLDPGILRLGVIGASKKHSIKSVLERLRYLFSILSQFRLESIALYLTECSHRMLIISHLSFIQKIKKCNRVLEVYILPFSDYLMLSFCKELQGQSNVYYYSDNMLIPPTSIYLDGSAQERLDKFEDGNYSSFFGIKRTCGFTRVNNFLNKSAQDNFFSQNQKASIAKERPSMLGFEKLLQVKGLSEGYIVSIFDVPPDSNFLQFCRSSSGDKISDFQFVNDFLSDFKNELLLADVKFLYKPKYSLTNYNDDYRALIASLKDSLGERFIMLDPYIRVGDIIENSDLVISFPYTSTKRFADFYGKKSLYYVPIKYADLFRAYSGYSAETIYGVNELVEFINDQK